MNHNKHSSLFLICLILTATVLASVACTEIAEEVAVAVEPAPELEVPSGVIRARDAVLYFLTRDANCCVPPESVPWQAVAGNAPEGFAVYRFSAETSAMTVAFAPSAAEQRYHVGFHNDEIGFCWQANVDAQGKVLGTGNDAELWPELADAAESYCTAAGYDHSVQSQPDGTSCGVCTFPDGTSCKAWLFYQGECGPDEG